MSFVYSVIGNCCAGFATCTDCLDVCCCRCGLGNCCGAPRQISNSFKAAAKEASDDAAPAPQQMQRAPAVYYAPVQQPTPQPQPQTPAYAPMPAPMPTPMPQPMPQPMPPPPPTPMPLAPSAYAQPPQPPAAYVQQPVPQMMPQQPPPAMYSQPQQFAQPVTAGRFRFRLQ